MGVQSVFVMHVAETKSVQLRSIPSSGGIDGEQNGPCDADADEADENDRSQEPEVEVGIKRRVLEHELVVQLPDSPHPLEPLQARYRRSIPMRMSTRTIYWEIKRRLGWHLLFRDDIDIGSWRVNPAERPLDYDEDQ